MIREILTIGHPTLRRRAVEVPADAIDDDDVQQLVDDLVDTMHHANGAGIAANQIGSLHRVAVIEVEHNPRYPYKPRIPLTVLINPVIELLDDIALAGPDGATTFVNNEGCLSVPNLRGDVTRSVAVRCRYLDREGVEHDHVLRGLTAGTFQHECDHLDGRLFVDRVTDPTTFTTWEQFERFHRAVFVERITAFVAAVGS